jgi:hypothetical protein
MIYERIPRTRKTSGSGLDEILLVQYWVAFMEKAWIGGPGGVLGSREAGGPELHFLHF